MNFLKQHIPFTILIFSGLLFIPFLGMVHLFDWDEINFAECAREMIASGNYFNLQMNFKPFWEKPPLFIWMAALSMKAFGVNEFAARLPNAICGILTLIILFKLGKRLFDTRMGLLWVLCYVGSTLPHFYFKSGIIDPWFNLFIFGSLFYFVQFSFNKKQNVIEGNYKLLFFSALLLGLAVLTKGPAAVIIVFLCIGIYYFLNRFKELISVKQLLFFIFIVLLSAGIWFLALILNGKQNIIENFISYQIHLFQTEDSGHGGPFYYHFLVLLIGCFPASVFALRSFKSVENETNSQKHFKLWMLILFWVVLLLFSIVKTKIIHYSSLCYFPLTFLSAYSLYFLMNGVVTWKKWMGSLLLLIGTLFGTALLLLPLVDVFKFELINSGLIKDDFAEANLMANVHWSGWEYAIGLLAIITTVYSVLLFKQKNFKKAILVLFGGNIIVIQLSTLIIVPKIEKYSQAAAIEFYKSLQNKDCYAESLNYLSYAPYFYTLKAPAKNIQSYSVDWLLNGPIDKPAYFVSKINLDADNKKNYPQLVEIDRKNGFVFYKREVVK